MTKKSKTGRPSKYTAKKRRDVCAYLRTHTIKATAKKFNMPPGTVGTWARTVERDMEAVAKHAAENTRRGMAKQNAANAKKAARRRLSTEELVGSMSLAALEQDATVKEVCIRLADELELYSEALDRKRRALNDAIAELRDV